MNELSEKWPDTNFRLKEITTSGDVDRKSSLQKIGGKGIFVKELEHELLNGDIDFAVHSSKDVMPKLPEGLVIGAIPKRASAYDCLLTMTPIESIDDIPMGAKIGTSSSRRMGQLKHVRPDLDTVSVRGNIETRIGKIGTDNLFGIVLADAGIDRLQADLSNCYRMSLSDMMLPAVGQGAMALECRSDDHETLEIINAVDDAKTHCCVKIERSFLKTLGGDCTYPIAGYAIPQEDNRFRFHGMVTSPDGNYLFETTETGLYTDRLGYKVAEKLIDMGALKQMEAK
ncbi:porphobilinogen deaminase [Furfurilactobacillus siliginis]|nr:porphobilinogen deaminase [Furfurilactobacillus siliginis]